MAKQLKHFYLKQSQCEKLEEEARSFGVSQAEIVRRSLDLFFGLHDNKPSKEGIEWAKSKIEEKYGITINEG